MTHCADLLVFHVHCCAFHTAMRLLLFCALFSPSSSLAWRDPGFCINCPDRVLVCHCNSTLAISPVLRHLWNQFHLFSFVATEKCAHHPGSNLISNFPCSFYLLEMWVLILALVCVVSVLELLMPVLCGIKCLLYLTLLPARALIS